MARKKSKKMYLTKTVHLKATAESGDNAEAATEVREPFTPWAKSGLCTASYNAKL